MIPCLFFWILIEFGSHICICALFGFNKRFEVSFLPNYGFCEIRINVKLSAHESMVCNLFLNDFISFG